MTEACRRGKIFDAIQGEGWVEILIRRNPVKFLCIKVTKHCMRAIQMHKLFAHGRCDHWIAGRIVHKITKHCRCIKLFAHGWCDHWTQCLGCILRYEIIMYKVNVRVNGHIDTPLIDTEVKFCIKLQSMSCTQICAVPQMQIYLQMVDLIWTFDMLSVQ